MPIYTYNCTSCEHCFESIQKMDKAVVECILCGQDAVRGISKPSPFRWGRGGSWN